MTDQTEEHAGPITNTNTNTTSSPLSQSPITTPQFSSSPTTPSATPPATLLLLSFLLLLYHFLFSNSSVGFVLQWFFQKLHVVCIWICILVTCLYKLGYVKRFIIWMTERELSKVLNGAGVTVSNVEVDFLYQHVEIFDLVVHTPQRDEWRWDSPLIGRIGRLSAHVNILSCLDHPFFVRTYSVKDIYSVVLEDIQAFVEKRRNVFNFHLLDDSLEIPNSREVLESIQLLNKIHDEEDDDSTGNNVVTTATSIEGSSAVKSSSAELVPAVPTSSTTTASENFTKVMPGQQHAQNRSNSSLRAETRANEIVTQVIGAVSTLGRAANEGGKEGLQLALQKQKNGFVDQLKKLQAVSSNDDADNDQKKSMNYNQTSSSNTNNNSKKKKKKSDGNNSKTSSSTMELIAKEGMRVMKHVGKVVEQNVSNIKEQVDSFSKPPPKKEGWVSTTKNDLFRVGGIVIKDMRVFTKDLMMVVGPGSSGGASNPTKTTSSTKGGISGPATTTNTETGNLDIGAVSDGGIVDPPSSSGDGDEVEIGIGSTSGNGIGNSNGTSNKRPPNASGWSKPILIKELVISSAELCPPMSLRQRSKKKTRFERKDAASDDEEEEDDVDLIPAVGQNIDKITDVLIKRLMVEMGKTNTGRLLHTAFGEVFAWMEVQGPRKASLLLS